MGRVPTICLSGLSETQRRACIIADNQLALNAGWDAELLKIELAEGLTDPDDAPAAPEHPVSEPGDLWILERHRLLCARWREWCSDPHRRGWRQQSRRGGGGASARALPCWGVALYRGRGADPDAGQSRMAGQRGARRGRRDPAAPGPTC